VLFGPEACVRFLQVSLQLLQPLLRRAARATRDLRRGRTIQTCSRLSDQCAGFSNRPFDVASQFGAGIGCGPCRVLRLLAAFESVVERESIVTAGDGVVGLLERLSGGGVLGRSVLFGTSSARCVDGALRL